MSSLPENFDLSILSSCYLEMISFGPSTTRFDFSRPQRSIGEAKCSVAFCAEGTIAYELDGREGRSSFDDPQTCAPVLALLLQDVTGLSKVGTASLRIDLGGSGWINRG